jgi:hypothetical protein
MSSGITGLFLRFGNLFNSPTNINMTGGSGVPASQEVATGLHAHTAHHGHEEGGPELPGLLPQAEPSAPLLTDHHAPDDHHDHHDLDDDSHHHG